MKHALSGSLSALVVIVGAGLVTSTLNAGKDPARGSLLAPVPFPPENPLTEPKRVLGKILFWDEQLSSDNTMSCGTCHIMESGGTDPVRAESPGPDGIWFTGDDTNTSFGMINADANDDFEPHPDFGLDFQKTGRSAPTMLFSGYADRLFWDGRAGSEFRDPDTDEVIIAEGGALENQIIEPPLSSVEMAHQDRDWNQITDKLRRAVPMALGSDIPPDMAGAIAANPSYPALFQEAFGDPAISAARIAIAMATYQRTLNPDDTFWDRFMQGDDTALTSFQQDGWETFQQIGCVECHAPPMFTDFSFRIVGVEPTAQSPGMGAITGDPADNGKFKVPTLRNVGLKTSFMHNGERVTMGEVFQFYQSFAPGVSNRDTALPIAFSSQLWGNVTDFLVNGLLDERLYLDIFPFDSPTLYSERFEPNPELVSPATPGTAGAAPRMIAVSPPNVGNLDFKVGLDRALAGADATVVVSDSPPLAGELVTGETFGPFPILGSGSNGYATFKWPIPARDALDGTTVYMQWRIDDPAAAGGVALSEVARLDLFCGGLCPQECVADLAQPYASLDFEDVLMFLNAFNAANPMADLAPPFGAFDYNDVVAYLTAFSAGCP